MMPWDSGHLVRMTHDVTCQPTETWCEQWDGGVTDDIANCTCSDCLHAVIDYAEDARYRLGAITERDLTKPDCECRAGSHPARENYLKGEAERCGAVCKLGWPL